MRLFNAPLSSEEARRILSYVLRRASTDTEFRRRLLDEPKRALEVEFDIALPDTFNIRFVENEGADATIVLPDVEAEPGSPPRQCEVRETPEERRNLSSHDLRLVSGGGAPGTLGLRSLLEVLCASNIS